MRLLVLVLVLAGCCGTACAAQFETEVRPLAGEDIAAPCHYRLTIAGGSQPIAAIWVIFDRGRDVHALYSDPAVVGFARHFRVALLLHGFCPGREPQDHQDMDMDPARGLGRALFAAINQFAGITGHPELSRARVLYLGFSGAGPLSARLVAYAPRRALAAVLAAPGHFDPMGINTVQLDRQAQAVPELVVAGGADDVSGTARPYEYFRKYWSRGAPWLFVLQSRSPHCCTANAKELILAWLSAVLTRTRDSSGARTVARAGAGSGSAAFIRTEKASTKDSFGLGTFNATDARVVAQSQAGIAEGGWMPAGWLPDRATAEAWLSFERMKQHPVLPLR